MNHRKFKYIIGFSPYIKNIWTFLFKSFLWNKKTNTYMEVIYVKSLTKALVKDGKSRFTLDITKKRQYNSA